MLNIQYNGIKYAGKSGFALQGQAGTEQTIFEPREPKFFQPDFPISLLHPKIWHRICIGTRFYVLTFFLGIYMRIIRSDCPN